ncbi:MAG TPA: HU family DNA-binding protein [Actinomycetota bacterium]|nr:HU family DNA-binding protein [Actinomycetota bacterium]
MNKGDLISRVAVDADISKREATQAVEALLDAIQTAVSRGERVSLPGFGTFEARDRSARTARNPQTGESINIKATTVPAFKAGLAFKTAVGGKKSGAKGGAKASAGAKKTSKSKGR